MWQPSERASFPDRSSGGPAGGRCYGQSAAHRMLGGIEALRGTLAGTFEAIREHWSTSSDPVVVRPDGDHPRVRIDSIAPGDIVKTSIGGRQIYGEVLEISDQRVHFHPITHAAGYRHATARQIVGHWRKAGRRRSGGGEEERSEAPPPEQLGLRINH